jgi:uncharacterized protein YPO0396
MAREGEPHREWAQWPGRSPDEPPTRRGLLALFAPSDDGLTDVEHLIDERGRELEERIESLQDTVAELDAREERVLDLQAAVETLLREGSAELDQRHADLATEAQALLSREEALAQASTELEQRRSELGAVELRRAAADRRDQALDHRQAELERLAGELRTRADALLEREAASATPPAVEPTRTDAHVLVIAGAGYQLRVMPGPAPAVGTDVDVGGVVYRVAGTGRSPFPGDDRRCAFLERS